MIRIETERFDVEIEPDEKEPNLISVYYRSEDQWFEVWKDEWPELRQGIEDALTQLAKIKEER